MKALKSFLIRPLMASLVFFALEASGQEKPPPITIAPQTTSLKGAVQTDYLSVDKLSGHTATTVVIGGTRTVLPVWHCGPKETAPVCKDCPKDKANDCAKGFNALVLLPAAAIAGAWIPPPAGLPTLTIPEDGTGVETLKPPETPTKTTEKTQASTEDESLPTLPLKCNAPSLRAADHTTKLPSTKPPGPIPTGERDVVDLDKNPLPVLPQTEVMRESPALHLLPTPVPTMSMDCGTYAGHPYWVNRNFYQYPTTFSRVEGLSAIQKFCDDMRKEKRWLGLASQRGATQDILRLYKLEKGDKKEERNLAIHVMFDYENRMRTNCKKNPEKYNFDFTKTYDDYHKDCYSLLGQTIDYCEIDNARSSMDKTWKMGGVFSKDCAIWRVYMAPVGEAKQSKGHPIPLKEWSDSIGGGIP